MLNRPLRLLSENISFADIEIFSLVDGTVDVPPREGFIKNASVEEMKIALRAGSMSDALVPIPFTATVIKFGDRLVLVDSGAGGFPTYGPRSGQLMQSMAAAGLERSAITTVLISHLHGDHIYGLMDRETNAQTFSNAEIVVPESELKWWTRSELDSADLGPTRRGLPQRIRATIATWKNVRAVAGDAQITPGVRAVPAFGHSPGQIAHLVTSGDKGLLLTADVSFLPALFVRNPEWQVALDQDGAMGVETRKRIFEQAVADKLLVTGTHWLLPSVGTIVKDGNAYAFVPIES